MVRGIQAGTRSVQEAPTRKFQSFCLGIRMPPVPLTTEHILLFITHLVESGAAPSTVKNHLSGLRFSEVLSGRGTAPFDDPRIALLKRAASLTPSGAKPVTLPILRTISKHVRLSDSTSRFMWTAMIVSFYGAFRLGKP